MPRQKITLDPNNARVHPTENQDVIHSSLSELGAGRSIVIDAEGEIIGGNGVWEQAQKLGLRTKVVKTTGDQLVVVQRVDLKPDDPRRKALALADNRSSDLSDWDEDMLRQLAAEVDEAGEVNLEALGLGEDYLSALFDDADAGGSGGGSGGDGGGGPDPVIESWEIVVTCTDEPQQLELLERLAGEGYKVRSLF